jgi:hypothetical protein
MKTYINEITKVRFAFENDGSQDHLITSDMVAYIAPEPTQAEIDAEALATAEYDAQAYARNRALEYPSLLELTVALYDTDDKADIEAKRAAVKAKYPKP